MLRKILLGLAVLVGGVLLFAATRPDAYRVERSRRIQAPADVIFAQLDDFRAWSQWSPWEQRDPHMQRIYEGAPHSVGASYAWQGNDEVGTGKMTLMERKPVERVAYQLEFIEPFESVASAHFELQPAGGGGVDVRWVMEGDNNFLGKLFGVFMDMDAMIGADFEKGLASLASVAEAEAQQRALP